MAKLLVLSLAETTSDRVRGYAVIARNLDEDKWTIIPALPKELLIIDGKYAWDIFAVTEADLVRRFDNRSDIYDVDITSYKPYMLEKPITDNDARINILEKLSSESIHELVNSPSWAGILKNPIISDLEFFERKLHESNYDPNQTFYWECRLNFSDKTGYKWRYKRATGVAVKDMRFKAYWRDLLLIRRHEYIEKKQKWLEYMKRNRTFLLVEFYPSDYVGTVAVVSGILCLNEKS
ncbi:hypothetical protein EDM56_16160 [Brevibacillus fluminis]|uniref:Uncharacterized protein n=1 Tax=Brevibacillus fluminis TaxID=511487 RepID=A0A3M8DGG3_9BACL|nr:hypothetical protein [Brevibacillus fluminis]RNB87210.1 hypothetical protein EDM56_16160 [Brevibacillus fluminis]